MKTIADNTVVAIISNLIRVVGYHTMLSNHRPTQRQNLLALATLVAGAIILGAILGTATAIDSAMGHVCNIPY